jgi:hypothetical protein
VFWRPTVPRRQMAPPATCVPWVTTAPCLAPPPHRATWARTWTPHSRTTWATARRVLQAATVGRQACTGPAVTVVLDTTVLEARTHPHHFSTGMSSGDCSARYYCPGGQNTSTPFEYRYVQR